jgi:hypothetical protein
VILSISAVGGFIAACRLTVAKCAGWEVILEELPEAERLSRGSLVAEGGGEDQMPLHVVPDEGTLEERASHRRLVPDLAHLHQVD